MNKKYYKVVKADLKSAVMRHANTGLEKQYNLNEWTHADKELATLGFGLFVFTTLAAARRFNAFESYRIFEVEIKNPIENPKALYFNDITKEKLLSNSKELNIIIEDTVLVVESVKLLCEVDEAIFKTV